MKPHIGARSEFIEFISSRVVKWWDVSIYEIPVIHICTAVVDESEE